MPLVRVDIIKGKSPEYRKNLLDCIHDGLVEAIHIEDWDRFQRIIEIDRQDFEISPDKTDAFMIIEITMFQGRSKEQKKAVIECITSRLVSRLGIRPTDVFIVIQDPPDENWGLGGKQRGRTA
jgi:4-oxalocrotonate tautomerase family enzyme